MESRIRIAFSLYAFAVAGIFLVLIPWTPAWEQGIVGLLPRATAAWATSGWFRGVVSALGALDLVVAIQLVLELRRSFRDEAGDDSSR